MGLDPPSPVHMRPPEPDPLLPPCVRHKGMAPYDEDIIFIGIYGPLAITKGLRTI